MGCDMSYQNLQMENYKTPKTGTIKNRFSQISPKRSVTFMLAHTIVQTTITVYEVVQGSKSKTNKT